MCRFCPRKPADFTRSVKILSPSVLARLKDLDKANEEAAKAKAQFIASQKEVNVVTADLVRKLHDAYPEVVSPSMVEMQVIQFEGHHYYCCQDREEKVNSEVQH